MGALAGLGVGGTVGGIVGALVGMGIPEYEAKRFEGAVKDGGVLLSVHCDTSDEITRAKEELKRTGARDIASSGEKSSDTGSASSKLEHAIEAIFAEWGTNTIGTFPGRTSEQAGGEKSGVTVRFTLDDVDRLSAAVPGIIHISPQVHKDVPVQNELHSYVWPVNGVRSYFSDIWALGVDQGRFFNGAEDQQRAHDANC